MRRSFHAFLFASTAGALMACASRWPAQRIEVIPGSVTGDSALEGGFRWVTLDGKAAPVEFPANSGVRIVYGTLDLRDAMSARSGFRGNYALRFTEQPVNDTVRTTGTNGHFMLRGDSLLIQPDGESIASAYRYAWRPTGELELRDSANHVWVYARR
jgi:hypothetical protein